MSGQFRLVVPVFFIVFSLVLGAGCDSDAVDGEVDGGILDDLTCEGTSTAIEGFFNSQASTWEQCTTVEHCTAIIPRVVCSATDSVIEECPVAIPLSAAKDVEDGFTRFSKDLCRALSSSCTNMASCPVSTLKCVDGECVFELDENF